MSLLIWTPLFLGIVLVFFQDTGMVGTVLIGIGVALVILDLLARRARKKAYQPTYRPLHYPISFPRGGSAGGRNSHSSDSTFVAGGGDSSYDHSHPHDYASFSSYDSGYSGDSGSSGGDCGGGGDGGGGGGE